MINEIAEPREIKPITMPGVHSRVYSYLKRHISPKKHKKVLDIGAGHGAMSKRLYEEGFSVSACDYDPKNFYLENVECKWADITNKLPYEDNSFHVVLLVEVMEHIHDHLTLFQECFRVLKKDGIVFFSTPNILSLKSRIRFLFTGFFYAFYPLDQNRNDGRQHVSSLTVEQYSHLSRISGFRNIEVTIDKKQKSSLWWSGLVPFIWAWCHIKGIPYRLHNKNEFLMGRLLFFKLDKQDDEMLADEI